MSSLGSPNPFFIAGKKAYEIERSLRFNRSETTYLNRTPSSAGNRKTWTISFWFKRCSLSSSPDGQRVFSAYSGTDGQYQSGLKFKVDDKLQIFNMPSGSLDTNLHTTRLFRDVSAWYHIVIAVDMTQSTASDRVNIYVNGVQETSFSTENYGTQNTDWWFNNNSKQSIGRDGAYFGQKIDGYLAEVNVIDGFQYDASYFGETNVSTGQWNPKKYVGGYGTTGFYLNFSDNSGTTATTLGKDYSGNGNNYTPYGFSVSAGVGNDSVEDTPTNNFATLNPLFMNGSETAGTFSEGNLKLVTTGYEYGTALATFSIRYGKYYWEVKQLGGSLGIHGIVRGTTPDRDVYVSYDPDGNLFGFGYQNNGSIKGTAGTGTTTNANLATGLATYTTNDIIGFASDISNGTLAIYKNNTLIYTITGINDDDWIPAISGYTSDGSYSINFGQQAFSYTPPTGYKKLNSANLPDPTILLPNKHFDSVLYTGNNYSGTRAITGYNFQPDWIWTKNRTTATSHHLYDEVRGLGSGKEICTDKSQAEGGENGAAYGYMTRYGVGGFNTNAGTDGSNPNYNLNRNGDSYVAWAWNAGDTDGVTYRVVVVSDSGNKFRFRNSANTATFAQSAVTLDLAEGGTYIFDGSDSTMASHPIVLAENSNGSPMYETGVTYELDGSAVANAAAYASGYASATTRRLLFTVPTSAPNLYYVCYNHAGMGGAINTNTTLGSSNFDGSTQSTVKANTTAGFSIVSYTGQQNASDTIGHGLGVTPQVVISKSRNSTYTYTQWYVHHHKLTTNYFLFLNLTNAQSDGAGDYYIDSSFSSTVFAVGDDIYGPNVSSNNYIAYCFSEIAGYSKFGKYVANGSTDGTFVYTGFRPAFILAKSTYNTEDWYIYDNKRDGFNVTQKLIYANLNLAEGSGSNNKIDFLSNGFKFRSTGAPHYGTNSAGYIYLAFAESPFKNARAR